MVREQGSGPPRNELSRRQILRGLGATTALFASGGLAACGSQSSTSGAMSFWQFYAPRGENPAQAEWFIALVDEWNRTHDRPVELQFVPSSQYMDGPKLQTSFSAEQGPDVFIVSPGDILRYANGDVLHDLTPYMSAEARADFYPDLIASRMMDDRIHALPLGGGPLALYYSVAAFESAGLSEGDLPSDWDQLLDVADKLTTDERFGLVLETAPGYFQNFTWYPYLWMAGGEVPGLHGGTSMSTPGTIEALTLWQDAIHQGVAPRSALGGGSTDVVGNLAAGYCGMQNAGMWGISALASGAPDFDYGVVRLPVPTGGDYTTATGGWAIAANSRGKDPDAAAEFCVWAIGSMETESVDRVARWCVEAQSFLPYRESSMRRAEEIGGFDSEQMRIFRDEIFPGALGEPRLPPEMNKIISDMIQACQLDGAEPADEAAKADEAITALLDAYSGAAPA